MAKKKLKTPAKVHKKVAPRRKMDPNCGESVLPVIGSGGDEHPFLALDRFARIVCNEKIHAFISPMPAIQFVTSARRDEVRHMGERLARETSLFSAQKGISIGDLAPRLRSTCGSILAVWDSPEVSSRPMDLVEATDFTQELRCRLEGCREASLSLLQLGDYYGCPVLQTLHESGLPPTWDDVFSEFDAWEQRLAQAEAEGTRKPDYPKLSHTKKKILSMCRKKILPATAIARKLELSADHTRRVLAQLRKINLLSNGPGGYRTMRAT